MCEKETDVIEVTPEMIEAGAEVICSVALEMATAASAKLYERLAVSVYAAMHRVRNISDS